MALITEDGTGLATAESYISVVDASAYLANLGQTNWATITTAQMEQALRRATNYMLQAYRERWTGYRSYVVQALDWPRYGVTVDGWYVKTNIVPLDIAHACADLAVKAAADDLAKDLDPTIMVKKIGPFETHIDRFSPQYRRFRSIDMRLSPYLKMTGMAGQMVRA